MDNYFDQYTVPELKNLVLNAVGMKAILSNLTQGGTAESFDYDGIKFMRCARNSYTYSGATAPYTIQQLATFIINRRRVALNARKVSSISREQIAADLIRRAESNFEEGIVVKYRGLRFTKGFGQRYWTDSDKVRYSFDEMLNRIERMTASRFK